MATYNDRIFEIVQRAQTSLEAKLEADVVYFFGEIRQNLLSWFREIIEKLAARPEKRDALAIVLTTPGGQAEAVEKLVEVVRRHYALVYFVVPTTAMSAGTIFCMSGDKIYMDYSSSLGPIDPQVLDRDGKFFVPALGYLDKAREVIDKSKNGTISPVEFQWLLIQDMATLRSYEQARDLSVALLEKWLVQYKFKDWIEHRTTNPGQPVTPDEKQVRAREIARLLSDNTVWHSHGRMIGMATLKHLCKLEIDDFGQDAELQGAVREYHDILADFLGRHDIRTYLYSSHLKAGGI